jgi:hypothetical protein
MQSIYGKVTQFLRDGSEHVTGFALEGGEEIRFSAGLPAAVSELALLGSRIEIRGELHFSNDSQKVLTDVHITNLDLNRTSILPGSVRLGKPGMLSHATPTTTASLALPQTKMPTELERDGSQRKQNVIDFGPRKDAAGCAESMQALAEQFHKPAAPLPRAQRSDAAAEIERAYDRLHSIQAILAYLNIMKASTRHQPDARRGEAHL